MEVRKIKHKLDSKGTKDKIIELFFEKHLKPIDIAKKLDVKMPYITKIIQDIFKRKNHERKTTKKNRKLKNEYMHKTKEKKKDKKNKIIKSY